MTDGRGLALYSYDTAHEQHQFAAGRVPSHRLLGLVELREAGLELETVHWPTGWPESARMGPLWQLLQAAALLRRRPSVVYCATEGGCQLALLAGRLLRPRVPTLVASVALLRPDYTHGWRRRLWQAALRGTQVTTYASAQVSAIAATFRLPPGSVHAVPLGVDTGFFHRVGPGRSRDPAVLSVGSNAGKDFGTLLTAACDPLLAGVRVHVVTDEGNATSIRAAGGCARVDVRTAVPISELRDEYARIAVVCVPLHDQQFSSGQTVVLEALAAGARVVVSDVSGLRDYRHPALTRVPPGDPHLLAAALRAALDLPPAEVIADAYTAADTARALAGLLT